MKSHFMLGEVRPGHPEDISYNVIVIIAIGCSFVLLYFGIAFL